MVNYIIPYSSNHECQCEKKKTSLYIHRIHVPTKWNYTPKVAIESCPVTGLQRVSARLRSGLHGSWRHPKFGICLGQILKGLNCKECLKMNARGTFLRSNVGCWDPIQKMKAVRCLLGCNFGVTSAGFGSSTVPSMATLTHRERKKAGETERQLFQCLSSVSFRQNGPWLRCCRR